MTTSMPSMPVALADGDELPTSRFGPLTRSHIVRYAGAGGDFNPIHHDEEFARAAGMPGVFGMGLLHGGMLAQRLTDWVGLANIRSFRIRFTGQVWPGDVLTFAGKVTGVREAQGQQLADVELDVTRQTGDTAIRANAVVVVGL
ncbi:MULTISPECIES: MaoC/PaaZ C-terminal domain-containing protein [Mycobacteriaceae]|uniref:MaoC/PaaZ C-terminal domain-containing protein n=1 Tax=Mycolicibacterium TaxID=1866885 RepID=UPI00076A9BF4|nr:MULTISPECIES: MaoC/PaaZ C-terminal domain-containing protein [Mycolicibacterium]MBN9634133.1 dihydroxy-acid dehydratase [Actinomycetota bacterium]MCT7365062.1 dihydroxy-acid dehydratase [Mycolicibacterium llatzerense]MCT7373034.1 dihydroxy-acid dehydratase [Mycolicibacterium llatzerense]MCX8560424.1 MaoC/PaaZ C-terminal domain-containing protein [Mycolicibacterium mucogenicum]